MTTARTVRSRHTYSSRGDHGKLPVEYASRSSQTAEAIEAAWEATAGPGPDKIQQNAMHPKENCQALELIGVHE